MITFSSSSHYESPAATPSESSGSTTIDCYETLSGLKEPISADWSLIVATMHFLAIVWLPTSSPTSPSVKYFTFICKVEETAPIP